MKILPLIVALVILAAPPAAAQPKWLETTDEARQRHSAERWQQYEQRRKQGRDWPALGGYKERLGDPAPPGTAQPGYTQPYKPYPGGRPWDGGKQSGYR